MMIEINSNEEQERTKKILNKVSYQLESTQIDINELTSRECNPKLTNRERERFKELLNTASGLLKKTQLEIYTARELASREPPKISNREKKRFEELFNTAREIDTARELASRESKPKPHSEHHARVALIIHSEQEKATDWKQTFFIHLNYMEAALELEKNRKKLETIAKEIATRNSKPEPRSESFAKLALEAHKKGDQKEYDRFLIDMVWHLKQEKRSLAQNSNPGPDQPTLQTLREKRKEETLKEQEIQPQIKQRRSR